MQQQGFSLTEVLCAQVLLGAAILMLTGCLTSAGMSMVQVRQKDSAMMMVQDIKARIDLVVDQYGYIEPASSVFYAGQIQGGASGSLDWQISPSDLHHLNGGQGSPVIAKPSGCILHRSGQTGVLLQWPTVSIDAAEPMIIPAELSVFQKHCIQFNTRFSHTYLGV